MDNIALATGAVAASSSNQGALAVEKAQMSVLRQALDTEQATAVKLLQTMGIGQNLNVVG